MKKQILKSRFMKSLAYFVAIFILLSVNLTEGNTQTTNGYLDPRYAQGQSGIIDKSGRFITRQTFPYASDFSDGLANVTLFNGKKGFVDINGKISFYYSSFYSVSDFSDGLASIEENCKYGFIDKTGKIVIKPKFDWVDDFKNGLALVEIDDKFFFIDKAGKTLFESKSIETFSEGLAPFRTSDKEEHSAYGFYDKSNKVVIEPKFHGAGEFSEGLAPAGIDGWWHNIEWYGVKYGFIDRTGKEIIPFKFDFAKSFSDGLRWSNKSG